MIPTKCEMQDLSNMDKILPILLPSVLIGDPGLTQREALFRKNFVRLIDMAISEHEKARFALTDLILDGGVGVFKTAAESLVRVVNHLESCINATARLLKILDRIKSQRGNLQIPRLNRRLVESHGKVVKPIRDTIEHMDERIQKGQLSNGNPIMLGISENGEFAIIGLHKISFF